MDQIEQEQVTFKCECKVVRKFALETTKLMHSLCHVDRANKQRQERNNLATIQRGKTQGRPRAFQEPPICKT